MFLGRVSYPKLLPVHVAMVLVQVLQLSATVNMQQGLCEKVSVGQAVSLGPDHRLCLWQWGLCTYCIKGQP